MHYAVFDVEDVHDLDAANAQRIGDHRAMTAPPDRFCAHHLRFALFSPARAAGPGRARIPRLTCSRHSREKRHCATLCLANRAKLVDDRPVQATTDSRSRARRASLRARPCHTADICASRGSCARRRLFRSEIRRAGRGTPRAGALNGRSSIWSRALRNALDFDIAQSILWSAAPLCIATWSLLSLWISYCGSSSVA